MEKVTMSVQELSAQMEISLNGKIYKGYKEWCRDNKNGFAKTYKEFCTKLAEHLATVFEDMVVKRSNGTFYRNQCA